MQILRTGAEVGFTVTAGGVIDSESDDRAPGGLHAPQNFFADFPGVRRVELIPDRAAEGLVDIFDGRRGCRREKLQSATRFRCPCDGQFAVGKERLFAPCRAQEDRAVVGSTEQIDTHVDLGGVAQAARAQLDVLEPFAIGAERGVVVDAACHVSPMTGLDLAASGLLEIEDVEGLGWASDDFGGLLGILGESTWPHERSDSAESSYVGARGQKLEKFATGGEGGQTHDGWLL